MRKAKQKRKASLFVCISIELLIYYMRTYFFLLTKWYIYTINEVEFCDIKTK